jgi:hypothetical protein
MHAAEIIAIAALLGMSEFSPYSLHGMRKIERDLAKSCATHAAPRRRQLA